MRLMLWLTFLLVLSAGCSAAPSGANPLAQHALSAAERYSFEGDIVEALDAGSYVYLRLRSTGVQDRWVATLRGARPTGAAVSVTVFGQAAHFHSARLGRDFDPLIFGLVRSN